MSTLEKTDDEKMLMRLEELSNLIGKNDPGDIAIQWDRAMFSIVIELVERAMALGEVTFKQVVIYVRSSIWDLTLDDTAEELDIDMLQGAYIAISGRYKEKGVTPKSEVTQVESVEDLIGVEDDWETEELAEMEAEYQEWASALSAFYRELSAFRGNHAPPQDGLPAPAEDERLVRPS